MDSWIKKHFRQDFARPLWPALLVFCALMITIIVSWRTAVQDIETQQNNVVSENATFIESSLKQRFSIYEDTLRAANGLFLSSDYVSRSEWKSFVNSLNLPTRYPGVRSVGYANIVDESDKEAYVNAVIDEGISTFHIYPDTGRSVFAPVTYVVPTAGQKTDDRTSPILGFDMYSDAARKQAMDNAAASGQPTMSHVVNLMVTGPGKLNGFVLYMPTYKKGMPHATPSERTAALNGFFYAPFTPSGVFDSTFTVKLTAFAFSIYDGPKDAQHLIYNSIDSKKLVNFKQIRSTEVNMYGQTWTIAYSIMPEIIPYSTRARPNSVAVGGTIFAASLALVIYLLIQRRTRALSYIEEKKLEEAKDELLSLASHQLRTPATAVKQYVSMVIEGFAGPLNKDQSKLLKMAYESNDRQLTIVDDLLYVARVDAGKATQHLELVNITELLQSVNNDQFTVLKNRKQAITYKKPVRPIFTMADPQYLRMIVENLLSNASKYSYENTKIAVIITGNAEDIKISFTDRGVGIDEKDYGSLFLKFSRIPNALSHYIAGSGIGLYLAKQLAMLHGGDIDLVSVLGKGTTFTLTLPHINKSDVN